MAHPWAPLKAVLPFQVLVLKRKPLNHNLAFIPPSLASPLSCLKTYGSPNNKGRTNKKNINILCCLSGRSRRCSGVAGHVPKFIY